MSFYKSIADNYKYIFPFKPQQLEFVSGFFKNTDENKLLDIGCARGELSFNLSNYFSEVKAVDLDSEMISLAKKEYKKENLKFYDIDMLTINEVFETSYFDVAISFGNTIVHLLNENQILKFFQKVKSVLKPNSVFLFQIVNYDRIIKHRVESLPTIENENVRFERNYSLKNDLVNFTTNLLLKNNNKTIQNSIKLFALKSSKAISLLNTAGFKNIELYGSFKKEGFTEESFPLIISCKS